MSLGIVVVAGVFVALVILGLALIAATAPAPDRSWHDDCYDHYRQQSPSSAGRGLELAGPDQPSTRERRAYRSAAPLDHGEDQG